MSAPCIGSSGMPTTVHRFNEMPTRHWLVSYTHESKHLNPQPVTLQDTDVSGMLTREQLEKMCEDKGMYSKVNRAALLPRPSSHIHSHILQSLHPASRHPPPATYSGAVPPSD